MDGLGQVETDPVIVIVCPGLIEVVVDAGMVWVTVNVVMEPGSIETMVLPACVKVVGIPGSVEVTTEVIVDAGMVTVVPGCVTVSPGAVIVVTWPGRVVTDPGSVEIDVKVTGEAVIVVKEPEIDVVIVGPKLTDVTVMKISDVVTIPGRVVTEPGKSLIEIETIVVGTSSTEVTVEGGIVMVVSEPEIEVVMVEAGWVDVNVKSSVVAGKLVLSFQFGGSQLTRGVCERK